MKIEYCGLINDRELKMMYYKWTNWTGSMQ